MKRVAISFLFALALGLPSGVSALTKDSGSCFLEPHQPQDFASYLSDVEERLGGNTELVQEAKRRGVWEASLRGHYAAATPADVYCLLGDDLNATAVLSEVETRGGDLFVAGSNLGTLSITLPSPDIVAGASVFDAVLFAVMRHWSDEQRRRCDFVARDQGAYERCYNDLFDDQDLFEAQMTVSRGLFQPLAPGDVTTIELSAGPDSPFTDFVRAVRTHATLRTPLTTGAPGDAHVLSLGISVTGFAQHAKTPVQWLSLITEDVARRTALTNAYSALYDAASPAAEVAVEALAADTGTRTLTIGDFRPEASVLERTVTTFLCDPGYVGALGPAQGARFWYHLRSFEPAICGLSLQETDLWYAPAGLDKAPASLRATLAFTQRQEIADRLDQAIKDLTAVTVDQSILLNELRRLAEQQHWDTKIAALEAQLQAAEAAAKDPGLLEYVEGLADLAEGGVELVAGVRGMATVWNNMPSPESGKVSKYLVSKRKDVSKAAKDLRSGAKRIDNALAVLDSSSRADARAEAQALRVILTETKRQYEALLAEIEDENNRYRESYAALSSEVALLEQNLSAIRGMLGNSAADIVALNVLAHAGQPGGAAELTKCAQTLETHVATNFGVSYDQISAACLEIDKRAEDRRECSRQRSARTPTRVTVLRGVTIAVLLANRPARRCFVS